jgi:hypothetical protein
MQSPAGRLAHSAVTGQKTATSYLAGCPTSLQILQGSVKQKTSVKKMRPYCVQLLHSKSLAWVRSMRRVCVCVCGVDLAIC